MRSEGGRQGEACWHTYSHSTPGGGEGPRRSARSVYANL